jgi:hypothetical protein
MESSGRMLEARFFEPERIDGALQRAYLANVLRFYFERARRYGLFDPAAEQSFLEHLTRLEKAGLQFRPSYEGYIVSLDQEPRRFQVGDARITVLTAADFAKETEFTATFAPVSTDDSTADEPGIDEGQQGDGAASSAGMPVVDTAVVTEVTRVADAADSPAGVALPMEEGEQTSPSPLSISLGEALDGPVTWAPSTQGSPHLFIIGIPGQGKSWTVTRILRDLAAQGVPALILDFHGQFGERGNPFVEAARPTVLDAGAGLPFSPFECRLDAPSNEVRATAYAIAEIFEYVAGLGEMQRDVVYTAIQDAYATGVVSDREVDTGRRSAEIKVLHAAAAVVEPSRVTGGKDVTADGAQHDPPPGEAGQEHPPDRGRAGAQPDDD